jgi:hypothetical protein
VTDECILPNFTLLRYLNAREYLAFTRSCWVQSSLCLATEPPAPLKITRLALRHGNFSLGTRRFSRAVAALSTCALLMVASLAPPQANHEQLGSKTPSKLQWIRRIRSARLVCMAPASFSLDADVAPATDVDRTTLHAALQVCQNDWRSMPDSDRRSPSASDIPGRPGSLSPSVFRFMHAIASTPQRQRRLLQATDCFWQG